MHTSIRARVLKEANLAYVHTSTLAHTHARTYTYTLLAHMSYPQLVREGLLKHSPPTHPHLCTGGGYSAGHQGVQRRDPRCGLGPDAPHVIHGNWQESVSGRGARRPLRTAQDTNTGRVASFTSSERLGCHGARTVHTH